ncbi:MAG TPA: UpxY family transcription antiterminator [Terriglobia bacterium]|nr:UpxY family transcription antiterminator [Terriglobia bacterium]
MQHVDPNVKADGAISPWYALCTRHQHEKSVAQCLSGKGFEVFLPLYRAIHEWQDRSKELSLPLFPGYVFLRAGLDRRIQVLTTPGVFHFVSNADRPIPIEQVEIDSVRQLTERGSRVEPHPFLKTGDWVRVKKGPLAYMEGILTRWKGVFRLVLSVELLQQSASVEVDAASVERVARRSSYPSTRYAC